MSAPPSQPSEPDPAEKPRKIRTWWHPLLVNLLRWQLGSYYHVEEEVPVGQKPLQIDILLLWKDQGELPETARQILAGLAEYFGLYTLLEFKSPSDTLQAGDFQTFLAYALLYRAQNQPLLDPRQLHMLVVAPKLTKPYREELAILGVTAQPQEPGIWRLQGGLIVHPTWVLETEVLAGLEHPLLTLISPKFLEDRLGTYQIFRQAGYSNLVVYLAQQVQQFHLLGEEFAMQHLGTEDELITVLRDMWKAMPPKERAKMFDPEEVKQLSTEKEGKQLLHDLIMTMSLEERLEELLRGLNPEQLERLRLLLQQPPPGKETPSGPTAS